MLFRSTLGKGHLGATNGSSAEQAQGEDRWSGCVQEGH